MQGLGLSQMVLIPVVVALLFLNAISASEVPRPLGVSLAKASLYHPQPGDNSWTCLDGSRTIPFSQINDDYCDCADGSDEPGTSACRNGQFHCLNKGHQPLDIPSSRVQDGICDCCDGSDESQVVGCPNTCLELGAAAAVQRRNTAELHKRGAERRQEMITRGKQMKAERESRRLELDQRRKEQEILRSEKEQLKKNAEALESEAIEIFREQQRELDAETAQAEQEPQQMRHEASLSFTRFDTNKDGFVEVTELMVDMNLDRDRNGVVTVEEAKYFLDERERVDLDAFVTLAWPKIKPLAMLADGLFQPPQPEEIVPEPKVEQAEPSTEAIEPTPPQLSGEQADLAGEEDIEADEEGEEDQYDDEEPDVGVGEASPDVEDVPPPNYDPETQRLIQQANEARNALEEVERSLREIEQEVKEIDDQNSKGYGLTEEWAVHDGQCYNFEDREYVYTLCPFDRASQKSRSGGPETTLGRWDKWIGEPKKYSQQKYSNGAGCWNGPSRSAIINISCALEPKITAVSEPNRCEYYFEFETPAACDSEAFQAESENLHDEL
ncbi:glucosidase 2 subunit beta [Drosophila eugracilis]|uniref:glucosidase 2 subunit beta n=1 Tax=Drosophila eugracilis TaxID=29029 RepID=UPI0007E73465|nr:glucosidase 2 subunit beta [Drosophila eugracilis]XP_017063924.1 glucosidase 2 subunit beta [Drosophila eugracilis]XP_017063925.1 glucosidase 2 subunit beta [Drosophila eugracilis]